jgi:GIY-YIG catalytic domain
VTMEDVKCDFDWDNASTDDDRFEASLESRCNLDTWKISLRDMGSNGHVVYSFWDDNQICIYVGLTSNPYGRLKHHIQRSKFAWEILEWRIEAVELDQATAERLETILIRRWNPRCNDKKSIYKVIEHTAISSHDASQVYFERSCRGTLLIDLLTGVPSWSDYTYEDFPQIVQDHEIRFQKWLQDHPDVHIRQWRGATGIHWSTFLSIMRLSFLQDVERDAA